MDSRIIGAAGEHYVICQLLRRGYVAAQAPEGVSKMDVVASDPDGNRLFAIQVKARTEKGSDGGWHMGAKHEVPVEGVSFCFVDFGLDPDIHPKCYVVPSTIVAKVLKRSHEIWGKGQGKDKPRDTSTEFRRFLPNYDIPNLNRPGISNQDQAWLLRFGKGWLEKYREAWAGLDSKAS